MQRYAAAAMAAGVFVMAAPAQAFFGPRTYEACMDDASTRPTDAGVKLAMRQCYEKFKKPAEEAEARKRSERSKKLQDAWTDTAKAAKRLDEFVRLFGEPTQSTTVTCEVFKGAVVSPPKQCTQHQWVDTAAVITTTYQIQTYTAPAGQMVWAAWEKPLP